MFDAGEMKRFRAEPPSVPVMSGYGERNYEKGLAARLMRRGHRICERPFGKGNHFSQVLEVGAGCGHHLGYVQHSFDRYVMTDMDTSQLVTDRAHVCVERQDATKLTYADNTFDRLIATHILEHLPSPHLVLAEWVRVLKPGGVLSIVLPCDPGLLWRTGRNLGPRRAAKKQGIAYDYVIAREHINSIGNLVQLIRHHFDTPEETWAPFGVPLYDANLFYICHVRV